MSSDYHKRKVIDEFTVAIRHVGNLELDEFYRWFKRWLKAEKYWSSESNETLYEEENIGNGLKHYRIKWKVEKAKTKFIKVVLSIDYTLIAIGTKKIKVDGQDYKVHNGDFEIKIKTQVVRTGEQNWLRRVYDNVINKEATDNYVEEFFNKSLLLEAEIREIFNQYA